MPGIFSRVAFVIAAASGFVLGSPAPSPPGEVPSGRLESLLGGPYTAVAAVAVVFLDPECPLSQTAVATLNALVKRDSRMKILGILPRFETGSPGLADFRARQAVRFPLIGDPVLETARALGARVTPEAFLIDSAGRVFYHGAVDNRSSELGKKRPRPTRVHLDSAWSQWAEARPVDPSHIPAVGCFIQ